MGRKEKKKRRPSQIDLGFDPLTKFNSFGLLNCNAQDLLGPISGNSRPKPKALWTLIQGPIAQA
jgi:hypothetical protein